MKLRRHTDIMHNDKTGAEGIGKKVAQSFPILTACEFDTTRCPI